MIKKQRNILHIQFEYNSIIRNRIVQITRYRNKFLSSITRKGSHEQHKPLINTRDIKIYSMETHKHFSFVFLLSRIENEINYMPNGFAFILT